MFAIVQHSYVLLAGGRHSSRVPDISSAVMNSVGCNLVNAHQVGEELVACTTLKHL